MFELVTIYYYYYLGKNDFLTTSYNFGNKVVSNIPKVHDDIYQIRQSLNCVWYRR